MSAIGWTIFCSKGTEEGATGTCYLAILNIAKLGLSPTLQLTGAYRDELVKKNGKWLFASRHIARDE